VTEEHFKGENTERLNRAANLDFKI